MASTSKLAVLLLNLFGFPLFASSSDIIECRCEYPGERVYDFFNWRRQRRLGEDSLPIGRYADYVKIDGLLVLPHHHQACQNVRFYCNGTQPIFPAWDFQCFLKGTGSHPSLRRTESLGDSLVAAVPGINNEHRRGEEELLNVHSDFSVLLPNENSQCTPATVAPASSPITQAPTSRPSELTAAPIASRSANNRDSLTIPSSAPSEGSSRNDFSPSSVPSLSSSPTFAESDFSPTVSPYPTATMYPSSTPYPTWNDESVSASVSASLLPTDRDTSEQPSSAPSFRPSPAPSAASTHQATEEPYRYHTKRPSSINPDPSSSPSLPVNLRR